MNAPKGGEQKKTQHNNEHWIEVWLWFIFNSQYVFNIYSLNVLLIWFVFFFIVIIHTIAGCR